MERQHLRMLRRRTLRARRAGSTLQAEAQTRMVGQWQGGVSAPTATNSGFAVHKDACKRRKWSDAASQEQDQLAQLCSQLTFSAFYAARKSTSIASGIWRQQQCSAVYLAPHLAWACRWAGAVSSHVSAHASLSEWFWRTNDTLPSDTRRSIRTLLWLKTNSYGTASASTGGGGFRSRSQSIALPNADPFGGALGGEGWSGQARRQSTWTV